MKTKNPKYNDRYLQVQFLDEDHVLLCLGPPDAPLQRSHEAPATHSFLLVLCLSQAKARCGLCKPWLFSFFFLFFFLLFYFLLQSPSTLYPQLPPGSVPLPGHGKLRALHSQISLLHILHPQLPGDSTPLTPRWPCGDRGRRDGGACFPICLLSPQTGWLEA